MTDSKEDVKRCKALKIQPNSPATICGRKPKWTRPDDYLDNRRCAGHPPFMGEPEWELV